MGVPFHQEQIQGKGLKSTGIVKDKGDYLGKSKEKKCVSFPLSQAKHRQFDLTNEKKVLLELPFERLLSFCTTLQGLSKKKLSRHCKFWRFIHGLDVES